MLKTDPPSSGNTALQSRCRTRGALDRSPYPPLSGPLNRPRTPPPRPAHKPPPSGAPVDRLATGDRLGGHRSIVPASRSTNHRDEGSESQGHALKTGRARTDVRPPTLRKTPSGSMIRVSGSRRGLPEDHARTFDGAWTRPATPSVAPASRIHSPSRPMSSHWFSPTSSGTSRGSPSICSICTSESSGDSTTAVGAVETWLTPSGNRM